MAKLILLNVGELAEAMNKSPWYVHKMRLAGYEFLYGTQTTLDHALAWRAEHTDFRTTEFAKRRGRRPHRAGANAGKHGEPTHSNG